MRPPRPFTTIVPTSFAIAPSKSLFFHLSIYLACFLVSPGETTYLSSLLFQWELSLFLLLLLSDVRAIFVRHYVRMWFTSCMSPTLNDIHQIFTSCMIVGLDRKKFPVRAKTARATTPFPRHQCWDRMPMHCGGIAASIP